MSVLGQRQKVDSGPLHVGFTLLSGLVPRSVPTSALGQKPTSNHIVDIRPVLLA